MQLDTLAALLKVPTAKLEALEADRWNLLPDDVFARALAASVCRTLKLDPAQVLGKPAAAAPRLMPRGAGINTTFREQHGVGGGFSARWHLSRPLLLAVLALLLGALLLMLLPSIQALWTHLPSGAGETGQSTESVALPSAGRNEAAPAVVPGGVIPPGTAPTPLVDPQPAEAVSAAPIPASEPQPAPDGQGLPAADLVVFKTTGPSWIEVTDAQGKLLLKRLMAAGDTVPVSGALPLMVVVGRVDVTSVEVRGRPFDLAAVSRNNVARFEVKP